MKIEQLQKELKEAIKRHDIMRAAQLQSQINAADQRFSLSEIIDQMEPSDKRRLVQMLNRIMVYSDLLDGYAIDFISLLRTFDKGLDVEIIRKAQAAHRLLAEIVRNVDELGDSSFSDAHGDMCDEVKLMVDNIFYKYEKQ